MAQLDAEGLDLRADRLRHPQSVGCLHTWQKCSMFV
jgi:hypothetical protein